MTDHDRLRILANQGDPIAIGQMYREAKRRGEAVVCVSPARQECDGGHYPVPLVGPDGEATGYMLWVTREAASPCAPAWDMQLRRSCDTDEPHPSLTTRIHRLMDMFGVSAHLAADLIDLVHYADAAAAESATGEQLDALAGIVGLERWPGESDADRKSVV